MVLMTKIMIILSMNPKTYLRKMLRMMMTITMFIFSGHYNKKPNFWLF